MRSIHTIDETQAINHRSHPIAPHERAPLATILAAVRKYFINSPEYDLAVREGSVTLQSRHDARSVIKILIDQDGRLVGKLPFPDASPVHLPDIRKAHPAVVGITLSHLDPYMRDALRDRLSNDFGWQYRDPRKPGGRHKFTLLPQVDFRYDTIILPSGKCPPQLEVTDAEYEESFNLIALVTAAEPQDETAESIEANAH